MSLLDCVVINILTLPSLAGGFTPFILTVESGIWLKILQSELCLSLSYRRYHVPDSQLNSCQGLDPRLAPLLPATVPTQEQGWHYVHLSLCCPVAFLLSTSMARDFPEVHSPPPPHLSSSLYQPAYICSSFSLLLQELALAVPST